MTDSLIGPEGDRNTARGALETDLAFTDNLSRLLRSVEKSTHTSDSPFEK
jgi:hypothetical protein